MIRLESSDGRLFAVDQESAYMSSLLKNIDQDLGTDINPILLHNVTGTILARVIEYCVHHRDDVRLDKDVEDLLQDDNQVEAWDRQFMN
ncbi:suppressor of kinetochore protein mutant, partial [Coemansia sp. RSA 551]